ncbi:ergothioneine biosynthesis protein EgtB [Marinoscillum furvescens]|uniref:Ergothioneine biosynthesis protein EgtB n=1 Tax=Marinoscillum furvescens DSM 4134 TaxID=1122208 RepID=A0A3D9LGI8_MARFU|nr:ergothioneine biosynthesis protein EgtB [Marinoscillum furvescens]REE05574.1 ergothioneine biosynthesis protein EgtB [Marinoscillum furvescens DSM 4134]
MSHTETLTSVEELSLAQRFQDVRAQTMRLVAPLETEDLVVQPAEFVSPAKWHLAHTTWFFEVFVLQASSPSYQLFHPDFPFLFNSYYVSAGDRWTRAERGFLTRPTVAEILKYRTYVEEHLLDFLSREDLSPEQQHVMEVGLQHEQQHQELLLYDIKYILGYNPLLPVYDSTLNVRHSATGLSDWVAIEKGNYLVGFEGEGFAFDNEFGRHEVHLEAFEIADQLLTNGEYLEFMEAGGYEDHRLWLSEGWDWVSEQSRKVPLYWYQEDGRWMQYTLAGARALDLNAPVAHLSYFEADAFARWKGCRLPTEFEWEVAQAHRQGADVGGFVEDQLSEPCSVAGGYLGNLWEWTSSAYLPYPFYKAPKGALGEYNGKFMINQKVLRGGSYATPRSHIRPTYRNFFHPQLQWMFSGVRLAKHK